MTSSKIFPIFLPPRSRPKSCSFLVYANTMDHFGTRLAKYHSECARKLKEEIMRFRKPILAAAFVTGTIAMAPSIAPADDANLMQDERIVWREDRGAGMAAAQERYPKTIGDDSSLAPGVPGVTEENTVGVFDSDDRMAAARSVSSGDDSTLAPRVPGVTEDSSRDMSERKGMQVEESLAGKGYHPGRIDGLIDGDTRAAIKSFQKDRDLAATGIIDPRTGELLGVVIESS
jgi:hypothetical protein